MFKQLELFQGTTYNKDSLLWKSKNSKLFTVKSAYFIVSGNEVKIASGLLRRFGRLRFLSRGLVLLGWLPNRLVSLRKSDEKEHLYVL